MDPSAVQFYAQTIQFLQCINMSSKFTGEAPNGYEIITHGPNKFAQFVRYNYNSFTKKISEQKLNLFNNDTGLKNYRIHLGLEDDKILTAVTGVKNGTVEGICPIFKKKLDQRGCFHGQGFFEILGQNLVKIGCGGSRENSRFLLNGTWLGVYTVEEKDLFDCEGDRGVFGSKIVFKNKEEDVCKQVDWAADNIWKAAKCSNDNVYRLSSKRFQLFSIRYLTIKFGSGTCKKPTDLSAQFLDNTYVKYVLDKTRREEETLETEEEIKQSEGKQNVLLIVGCSVGGLVVVVLVTLVIVWRYRKCKQPLNPAFHVRYDFGLAPGMQTAKTCPNGFKKTKLKSGTKLVVPNVIDDVKVNKMVAQGRFGAFFLYKLEKDLFWYKLEAKLKSPFRNPLASESGVCRLVQKTDDAVSAFIGNMINCGYYSEGVYYMRVENLGPSVRELRKGVVLPGGEVAKIAYQMLPCMRALVVYGICHRNIKESAFYFKKDELAGNPKMIITDLGFAIRIGSARTDFYPIPELATTFIHEKKASAVQDAESLIFMLLSMMIERLPWAGIKKTEAMTEAKVKYLASDMEGTSLEGNKTAGYFLSMREVFMSDPKTENPAEHMFNQLTTLMNPSELCLPIAWPERDANTDESVADSSQKDSPKA